MTNEEMQRLMKFILEQRAQFAAGMQQIKEMRVQTERTLSALKLRFPGKQVRSQIGDAMVKLAKAQAHSEAKLASLAETQARTAMMRMPATNSSFGEMDKRLSNLRAMVEQYIRERRNGKSEDQGS